MDISASYPPDVTGSGCTPSPPPPRTGFARSRRNQRFIKDETTLLIEGRKTLTAVPPMGAGISDGRRGKSHTTVQNSKFPKERVSRGFPTGRYEGILSFTYPIQLELIAVFSFLLPGQIRATTRGEARVTSCPPPKFTAIRSERLNASVACPFNETKPSQSRIWIIINRGGGNLQ